MENINQNIAGGSVIKKVLKHSSAYFVMNVVSAASTILMLPFYTRHLNPTDYGTLSVVLAFGELAAIFMGLKLDGTFGRYFFEFNQSKEDLRKLFSTCFWAIVALGTIVFFGSATFCFFYFHIHKGIQFFPLLVMGCLIPFFNQIFLLNNTFHIQTQRSKVVTASQLSLVLGGHLLSLILFLTTDLNINARIIPIFIATLSVGMYLTRVNVKNGILSFLFDWGILKKIIPFSLGMMPGLAAGWIYTLSDRLIIAKFGKLQETGIYTVGYQIGQCTMFFTTAVFVAYTPIMYAKLSENFEQGVKSLAKPILGVFWFMSLVSFFFYIFSTDLIYYILNKDYYSSHQVLAFIIPSFFFGSQYVIFANILGYKKRVLLLSFMAIAVAIVNLACNFILIPHFGKQGAAASSLLSVVFYTFLNVFFALKEAKVEFDWGGMFKTLILFLINLALFNLIGYLTQNRLTAVILKTLLIPLSFIITTRLRIFDKQTTDELLGIIQSRFKKIS